MPLKGAVDLNAFGFVYDGEKHYFPSVHVTLRNSLNWRVLNVLTLEKIDVSLDAIRASESAPRSVTGHLKAVLRLVGAELELTASTPAEHAPWQFQGRLLSGYRVDFQAILRKLIAPDITLPSGNGFPTALALQTAEASLEPTTKTFDLVGFAYTDWSLSFAEIPTWHPAVGKVIPVAIRRWRKNIWETIKSGDIADGQISRLRAEAEACDGKSNQECAHGHGADLVVRS